MDDENIQSYNINNNHQWLQYNYHHQDPIHGGLDNIPFDHGHLQDVSPDDFFMADPTDSDTNNQFVGGVNSRFVCDTTTVNIPKENSTAASSVEDLSPRSGGGIGKTVRRRSRASRRTPPTLLNANVKNFRALVQEYTGCKSEGVVASSSSSSLMMKNQKGPINLSFGIGSSSNINHHQQMQQISHDCFVDQMNNPSNYREQMDYQQGYM